MSALNLLVLRAQDPDQLAAFYAQLGLSFQREQHGSGLPHHSSRAGGSVFEIYPCINPREATTNTRIGFQVASIDAVIAACAAPVLSQPKLTPWGKRAVIQDPEGHKVELVEVGY
jgi:lactoylglutathione lyase